MMDIVGLRGEKVRLVPPDRSLHLENSLGWLNDPDVTRYLNMTFGVTRGMEEEWFDRIQKRDADFVWAVLDEHGRHIGFTGIHGINWRFRTARTGTVIGEKDAWGRGYGGDTIRVRTRFAFEVLGLHRLESEARVDNLASRRALEKAGYREEGVARKNAWYDGAWHDSVRYAILEEEYFAAK